MTLYSHKVKSSNKLCTNSYYFSHLSYGLSHLNKRLSYSLSSVVSHCFMQRKRSFKHENVCISGYCSYQYVSCKSFLFSTFFLQCSIQKQQKKSFFLLGCFICLKEMLSELLAFFPLSQREMLPLKHAVKGRFSLCATY